MLDNPTVSGSGLGGTGGGTTNESYAVDAANRLTSRTVGTASTTVTSDANGNTLSDGKRTMTWDSENRLVSCTAGGSGSNGTGAGSTTSAFVYGSDGMRRRGTVTNNDGTKTRTDYVYDGQMMVEEIVQHFSATNSALDNPTTITYFQGPQGPLYRKSSNEADPHWYLYDGLGSVVGEVDPLGNVTASKLFDVYGATRGGSGSPTTRQGFVGGLGHQTDDETGLVYMRARYYDPGTGRFVSEDPSRDGNNWYAYASNNPVNKVDPDGRQSVEWAGFCAILMGLFLLYKGMDDITSAAAKFGASLADVFSTIGKSFASPLCDLLKNACAIAKGSLDATLAGMSFIGGVMAVIAGACFIAGGTLLMACGDEYADVAYEYIHQGQEMQEK